MATPKNATLLPPLERLWFLAVANGDFGQCAHAADRAIEFEKQGDRYLAQGLSEVAIIRFARPFCRCVVPQERAPRAPRPPQLSARLPIEYMPNMKGAKSVHEGVMRTRDRMYAHSDLENKPIQLRRRKPDQSEWRWVIASKVPRVGVENLRNLARIARALELKTAIDVAELAEQVLPGFPDGKVATIGFQRGSDA